MLRLALGSIRGRVAAFSGAVLAIVFAASLVVACGVLIESALRSDIGGTTRFAGAAAVVQARPVLAVDSERVEEPDYVAPEHPPLPESLVDQVAALPGVRQAVGDYSFYAQALGSSGEPLASESGGPSAGHPWASAALTPFTLRAGREPEAADEVVLDADLALRGGYQPGDAVPVITPSGVRTFSLSGIAAPPDRDGLKEQSTLFFSAETARDLAPRPEEPAVIGILADSGVDTADLRRQLLDMLDQDRYDVLTGGGRSDAEAFPHQVLPRMTTEFLGTASGLTGFVTIFIVSSTFSFSVQQRSREIALLRAVAATPRQIMRMVLSEAAVIALLGSALGTLLGFILVFPLRWLLVRVRITPPDMELVFGPIPVIAAVVASLIIAEVAVFFAARRAARIQPSSALREAAIETRRVGWLRFLVGLMLGAAGLAGFYFVMEVPGEAGAALSVVIVMALCVAGGMLGPVLVWPIGWLGGGLLTLVGGVTSSLGRSNVLMNRRRAAAVAIPLMLTACFATLFLFIGAVQEHGVVDHTGKRLTSDYVAVPGGADGFPVTAAAAIQDLPEVSDAAGTLATTVVMNTTPIGSEHSDLTDVAARGVDPEPLSAVLELGVASGNLVDLREGTVAISDLVARGRGLDVGDQATLWLPDGTRITPRVIAVYEHSMGFADVLLPRDLLAEHSSQQLDADVFVTGAPGSDPEAVQGALEGLRDEIPTLQVIDGGSYADLLIEDIQENTRVTYLLAGLAVIYTAIAIVNTLMMSISERTREFARLRMIGAERWQVVRMILWETVIIVALGVGLGVGISLLANLGFSAGLLGSRTLVIPWFGFVLTLIGVTLLGFGSSAIPAWLASRSQPHSALGFHD